MQQQKPRFRGFAISHHVIASDSVAIPNLQSRLAIYQHPNNLITNKSIITTITHLFPIFELQAIWQ